MTMMTMPMTMPCDDEAVAVAVAAAVAVDAAHSTMNYFHIFSGNNYSEGSFCGKRINQSAA